MNGFHNGTSNGHHSESIIGCDLKQTEQEILGISDYSSRLERILLSLLKQQDEIKNQVAAEKRESEIKENEILAKIESEKWSQERKIN